MFFDEIMEENIKFKEILNIIIHIFLNACHDISNHGQIKYNNIRISTFT